MIEKPLFTSFYQECSVECDKIVFSDKDLRDFEEFIKNKEFQDVIDAWVKTFQHNLPKDISPIVLDNLDLIGLKGF